MSVLESVKAAIGVDGRTIPTYRCKDCGEAFETTSEPDSHWFECPDCGSGDAEAIEES